MGARHYLVHQVVNLVFRRTNLNLGVQQSCGAYQLFYNDTFCFVQLIIGWGSTDIDHLIGHLLEFLESQGTVVEGCRQSEAEFHQISLTSPVATIHSTDLRHTDVTLVNHHQIVFWEEVEQTVGSLTGLSSVKVSGIVLNTRTMAQFLDHLHIIFYAFLDALGLDAVTHFLEESHLFHQIVLNLTDGNICLLLRCHKQVSRIEFILLKRYQTVHRHSIQFLQCVYLVVPKRDTQNHLTIGHCHVHRITFYTEAATFQFQVVPDV